MSDLYFELETQLNPALRRGDLKSCFRKADEVLARLPESPFHLIRSLSITNDPLEVAQYFDEFFEQAEQQFKIAAAYTETNGFEINPDRWFFNPFAYEAYGGHDDYDWLADWQAERQSFMTITGLEPLQAVYASEVGHSEQYRDAWDIAGLLVVLQFQRLIKQAADHMERLRFPLLATAHDRDFLFEYLP